MLSQIRHGSSCSWQLTGSIPSLVEPMLANKFAFTNLVNFAG
jgi:hypothetical protein